MHYLLLDFGALVGSGDCSNPKACRITSRSKLLSSACMFESTSYILLDLKIIDETNG